MTQAHATLEPIPYGRHCVDEDDVAAAVEVLRGDWLTQGPKIAAFEEAVAARCGAKHAVAVSSGTAALHVAMLAARIGDGDEFVSPAMTFLATANCGLYVGATPSFCDIDAATGLMTPDLLEAALTDRTKAVLPVHFAGVACDMPALGHAVRARCPEALIIEDASHALGSTHVDGTPVGALAWADMAVFSFHPVKHIAAGEGGMVLTDRDDLADRLRLARNHGMTKHGLTRPDEGPWYYEMQTLGYNYRTNDIAAALGLSQLTKLDRFVARRRAIAQRYHDELGAVESVALPAPRDVARSSWHIYVVRVDFEGLGRSRRRVVEDLRSRGVGTQVHYYPVPLQPFYRERFGFTEGMFPGAEKHYAQCLTLPLFPGMSDAEVDRVIDAFRGVIGNGNGSESRTGSGR